MGKLFALLFFILMSAASAVGYFYLNEKIKIGEQQLAEGARKISEGEQTLSAGKAKLAAGKAKLAAGKRQLTQGKQTYHQVKNIPFDTISQAFPKGKILFDLAQQKVAEGGQKIATGEQQVAAGAKQVTAGEQKIRAGEEKLRAGKIAFAKGQTQLNKAKQIRFVCAASAIFFSALFFVFGLVWWVSASKKKYSP